MIYFVLGPAALIVLFFGARTLLAYLQRRESRLAVERFHRNRERLEAKFFEIASQLGKPRGVRWSHCDWQPAVAFARDQRSRLFTAFVGVEIAFEAIEGGDMEDVAAVSTVRDAAAVFHYQGGTWGTGGKALFNMNPQDAIARLEGQFEAIPGL